MGRLDQESWDRYISESLASSDNQSDAIESRLAGLAIEFRVAELMAEESACNARILEIRDEVACLRDVIGSADDGGNSWRHGSEASKWITRARASWLDTKA